MIRPGGSSPVSRRSFLRVAGLSAAAVGGAGFLAACASSTPAATSAAGTSATSSTATSAAASMATSAMGSATGAMAPTGDFGKIAVQLSWIKNIEFAGEFHADSKGYYKAAGFSAVDLVSGPVDSADALVFAGSVDIGLSTPDATARLITEQGAPLKIIGSTYQKNPFCILSLEERTPIRTVADLAGKRIGIQAGTNQSIFAGLLAANGIDPATVTQVTEGFDPAPLMEAKPEIDGFMAYLTNEPFLVKGKGFTPVTLSFADNGLPLTAETFTVTQDTLDTKREMLKAFLWAEIKGWNDALASPADSAALAVNTYGKDLSLVMTEQVDEAKAQNELVSTAETKANGLFTISDKLMGEIGKALKEVGITIDTKDLFDLTLLAEVYTEHPELIAG